MLRHLRLDTKRMLFLQLDIVEKFRTLTYKYPSLVSVARLFMETSNVLDMPIMMIEANKRTMGETAKEILEVKHPKVIQFEKTAFSCLDDTGIYNGIKKMNPKDIVLYGMEAHACVLFTTLDLLKEGYNVHLVVDGISCINKLDRSVALQRMGAAGATFTTSETVLLDIAKDSVSPNFKPILKLIKGKMKVADPLTEFI